MFVFNLIISNIVCWKQPWWTDLGLNQLDCMRHGSGTWDTICDPLRWMLRSWHIWLLHSWKWHLAGGRAFSSLVSWNCMFTFEYIYVYKQNTYIYISFWNIIYVLYIVIYLYKTYLRHVNTIQQIHLKIKNIIVLI